MFDGLCFIPVQPLSWLFTHIGRIMKHYFKGQVYLKLSYFFDADFTPFLLLFILFLALLNKIYNRNELKKRPFLENWQIYVLVFSPLLFFHKYYVLHNHQLSVVERLDEVYPVLAEHHLIYHKDDFVKSNSLVSVLSVFSARGHIFEDIFHMEHNQLYSHAKSILNHFASRPNIPHSKVVTYKIFEPLPESQCSSDLFRRLGIPFLSKSRKALDDGNLTAEVYFPVVKNPKLNRSPLFICVHGGGWRSGDKRNFQDNYLGGGLPRFLLENGITVAAISYRIRCTGASGYDMVQDVYDAIRYFTDNADEYNIDPNSIFLLGTSAGAHLTMLTALTKQVENLKGVIFFYGPTESRKEKLTGTALSLYENINNIFFLDEFSKLCAQAEDKEGCLIDMSAVAQVKNCDKKYCPPTLLIHGHQDPIVPITQSYLLEKQLKSHGVKTVLIDIPCSSHACEIICSSHCAQASLFGIERFLNNLL